MKHQGARPPEKQDDGSKNASGMVWLLECRLDQWRTAENRRHALYITEKSFCSRIMSRLKIHLMVGRSH